eukprot:CAMPEP_0206618664 /NCGR_PEP_ID=MMETSP0325_2-20121206/60397_1 /ASSEMBLY_ACC=CAM_ASM_000347 /TAXON_ID=2866 /ORGANISM="Crypthecodinium cohnii, Strain Seligo" /LENGTH=254 /DNA_ID=CAMNT_0054140945 /DNA_START=21 /DNA_END=785 /DNA_ORIENTATION=-
MYAQVSTGCTEPYFEHAVGTAMPPYISSLGCGDNLSLSNGQHCVGFQERREATAPVTFRHPLDQGWESSRNHAGVAPPGTPPIPLFARSLANVNVRHCDTRTTTAEASADPPVRRMARHQKNRHCKYKRDRYRRMVQRLVAMAINDPRGFAFEMEHNLPPSIAECPTSRAKLEATINALRAEMEAEMQSGVRISKEEEQQEQEGEGEDEEAFVEDEQLWQGHVGQGWELQGEALAFAESGSTASDGVHKCVLRF